MNKILKNFIFVFFILLVSIINVLSQEEKIKIGILVPLTGENKQLGQQIIKASRLAIQDINSKKIELYPKDTQSNPDKTLKSAKELQDLGINIVIGPVFYQSLRYLNDLENITFLSFTNKTIDLPNNVISSGINAASQIDTIKKFIEDNQINKTIFLTPQVNYEEEIKKAIKQTKIKIYKQHTYNKEPTKLTKQIEKITNYKVRKQNVIDEIKRIENSDLSDSEKERRIIRLKKKYTIGRLKFDSIIIADFDESLKSVITSLLYTDVSPKDKFFITFNQWFDESILNEKSLQPIYYPSIDKENLEIFKKKFYNEFNEQPNHLTLLSYDLVGLVYYLIKSNNNLEFDKLFKKKNSFKGKIGVFEIKDNKINHKLNFYQIEDRKIKKIF
tara:strand:+ start:3741 stop:4901 length:1161 start_codon:yes stop_codon:yes gene_type:complete